MPLLRIVVEDTSTSVLPMPSREWWTRLITMTFILVGRNTLLKTHDQERIDLAIANDV